ncbi:MAG: TadE/TadG family type IV pilus assembly protein [Mesorhizobium sp.]
MANPFTARVRRFSEDSKGHFAIMFAASVSMLTLSLGLAVNYAQMVNTRSSLLHALDSAITSTARDITTGAIEEKDAAKTVLAFLEANSASPFADPASLDLFDLKLDPATKVLSAKAAVDVALAFPIFNTDPVQRITVDSAARYSDRKIEVAMMLDITGSMKGQKLKDLQAAAGNAVGLFLDGQSATNQRIRVAIVPYADSVNAGVLSRYVYKETGFTPDIDPPKFDPAAPIAASGGSNGECATERKGSLKFSDASPYDGMINRDSRLLFCPAASLQPLTADKTALIDTIDEFKADGHTAGGIGIQWTRYMLSPKWASVMPQASVPGAYDARTTAKIAILMTDGEFNTAFAGVPNGKNDNPRSQATRSNDNALEHCKAMKKDGVEVFTIGFMLKEKRAKDVMSACATADTGAIRHYYEVSSGSELDNAFREIAANVERLAIIK